VEPRTLDKDVPVRANLDLSSKLALVFLLWVCAFTLPWTYQIGLCILLAIARHALPSFRPISRRSASAFSKFILYSITVAVLVVSLNALLIKSGNIVAQTMGFSFYEDGLQFGLRTASRLILLSFSILMFFISTPLPVLIDYLQRKGLPPNLVLVLLLTLHFLDHLPSRIHQIFLAQQARGAPVDAGILSRTKALLSILSPLVLSSIVESIERGTALELRGFLSKPTVELRPKQEASHGNVLTFFIYFVSIALIVYSIYRWLSV
jgi:energy-coupling factor transport system permease protein